MFSRQSSELTFISFHPFLYSLQLPALVFYIGIIPRPIHGFCNILHAKIMNRSSQVRMSRRKESINTNYSILFSDIFCGYQPEQVDTYFCSRQFEIFMGKYSHDNIGNDCSAPHEGYHGLLTVGLFCTTTTISPKTRI